MDNKIFKKAFRELLDGNSVRSLEKKYNINKDEFIARCKKEFPEGTEQREKLEQILKHNKQNAATKNLNEKELEQEILKLIKGETDLKAIADKFKIHKQSLNEKIEEFINNTDNQELKEKFWEYQKRKHPDYSYINFRALIIEMIERDCSQTEIAKKYGIPARVVSRKIEELNNDEEKGLYLIAKEFSERKMKRKKFNIFEIKLMGKILKDYDRDESVINLNIKTKEELEYEKNKQLIERAKTMLGTQEEIARKLNTSVSGLRRAKLKVEEYERKNKTDNELVEEGER